MGLLIYICIRLVTDTASGFNVLLYRNQWINAFEIVAAFGIGFVLHMVIRRFESYQSRQPVTLRNVAREFGLFTVICVVTLNSTVGVVTMVSDDGMDSHDFVVVNLIPLLFMLIIYSLRRGNVLLKAYVAQQTELERIKRDQSETELSFLKSQYHPHFLFNALNTIYFQMDGSIDQAKKTIEKLSDLLRYQLYEGQHDMVEISKELEFIQKYVTLQQERLSDSVRLAVEGHAPEGRIYPLLTMPAVENAFKYVGGKEKFIEIRFGSVKGKFEFVVRNSYQTPKQLTKYSGLGLPNVRRRLDLLYPDQYALQVHPDANIFEVKLAIPIS